MSGAGVFLRMGGWHRDICQGGLALSGEGALFSFRGASMVLPGE